MRLEKFSEHKKKPFRRYFIQIERLFPTLNVLPEQTWNLIKHRVFHFPLLHFYTNRKSIVFPIVDQGGRRRL